MWRVLCASDDVDKLWMKAKECGYFVTPPQSPQVDRKRFDMEKIQREREEEAECRRALRERDIPPYFDSDVAECFSKQVCVLHIQRADIQRASQDVLMVTSQILQIGLFWIDWLIVPCIN